MPVQPDKMGPADNELPFVRSGTSGSNWTSFVFVPLFFFLSHPLPLRSSTTWFCRPRRGPVAGIRECDDLEHTVSRELAYSGASVTVVRENQRYGRGGGGTGSCKFRDKARLHRRHGRVLEDVSGLSDEVSDGACVWRL